jgi:hypothetical protein
VKHDKNKNPWNHFDEAWKHINRGFEAIDWSEFKDTRHSRSEDRADPLGRSIHVLTASTMKSRIRISWIFIKIAWLIISSGKAKVKL